MKLFPFILGRSGGASITSLEPLKSERVSFQTQQLRESHHQLTQIKSQINDLLYERISNTSEPATQNRLLTLKRDIYNDRINSLNLPHDLLTDTTLISLLKRYFTTIDQQKEDNRAAEAIYQLALSRSVDQLNDIVAARYFQNGLLMASSDLYQRNIAKSVLDFANKKDRKLAFTLLKYLTRSVAKTTPFATFNSIFCLEPQGETFKSTVTSQSSHLSINNLVFHYLQETIVALPETRNFLTVTLNPTVREDETHLYYFINQANNDAFRKIKNQPLSTFLVQLLQEKEMQYWELANHVIAVANEPLEKVRYFLDQLIDGGLLLTEFPASSHDQNWPEQIISFTEKTSSPNSALIDEVIRFLQTIACTRKLLEKQLNVRRRRKLLNNVYQQLEHLHILIAEKYPTQKGRKAILPTAASDVFYEDSTTSDGALITARDVSFFQEDLLLLNRALQPLTTSYHIREECKRRLVSTFGTKPVPVLRFLEQVYYPQKEAIFAEAMQRLSEKGFCTLDIATLTTDISTSWPENAIDLRKYVKQYLPEIADAPFGVFCQLVMGEHPLCIVNNLTPGFGKNISRFLNFYPVAAQSLRETVRGRFPDANVVEIKDASLHNTNLYPTLGNASVAIPGVSSEKADLSKIHLKNLFLRINEHNELVIQDQAGRSIIPIDFAMEGIQRKSALAQFFNLFNPADSPGVAWTRMVENFYTERPKGDQGALVVVPRLCFGPHLVLKRKKWIVKKKVILKLLGANGRWENFAALQQWRQDHQIPREVYVKISHSTKHTTDHYKPQYINFEIPLLAEYFVSLVNKADALISLTEMLPQVEDILPEANGQRLVKEYILNFV